MMYGILKWFRRLNGMLSSETKMMTTEPTKQKDRNNVGSTT